MIGPDICVPCKGTKNLCGLGYCPLLKKILFQKNLKQEIKEDVFGPSGEIFVGSRNYPNISVGPMVSTFENPKSPKELYGLKYDEVIKERTKLVRGKKIVRNKRRIESEMEEVGLSTKSVDVEMKFSKKPNFQISFSSILQPMGGSGEIKKYRVTENPKIPKKVDSVLGEKLTAVDMMDELYSHGFDNYYLTKIMSVGVLGKEERKKIVPTRWSITATDDILGKKLIGKIKEYPQLNEILVFSNEFLENHFEILLIPGNWEFENFECWSPKSIWAQGSKEEKIIGDYENYSGRTKYSSQAGGYYASRLGVVEYLNRIRKQARVVVFREIREGYVVPVGVWEVRENVRNAFLNRAKKFQTVQEALEDISTRLNTQIKKYIRMSKTLQQSRLNQFF